MHENVIISSLRLFDSSNGRQQESLESREANINLMGQNKFPGTCWSLKALSKPFLVFPGDLKTAVPGLFGFFMVF